MLLKNRVVGVLMLLAFIAVVILAIAYGVGHFDGLKFHELNEGNLLALTGTLFVVATFMERSVEAVLTPIRWGGRATKDYAVREAKAALAVAQQAVDAAPSDAEAQKAVKTAAHALNKAEKNLEHYRVETAQRAYMLSFFFGLVVAMAGIRVLGALVSEQPTDPAQLALFRWVDIILTGTVLSGGSAAIDKLGRRITEGLKPKT